MTIVDLVKNPEPLEPETLTHFFPGLSPLEREKIFVTRLILHTNQIFEDMDVFENAVQVLNDISPDTEKTEGVLPEWIWFALPIIKKLRGKKEYSHEVQMYIRFIYNDNGIYFYPVESGIENKILEDVILKAEKGPFPLKENFLGIQAFKYLKIKEYIKNAGNTIHA